MACRVRKALSVNPTIHMKYETPTVEEFESTYALILRSEKEERSVSESVIYLLLILSALFSIWEVAHQPFQVPTNLIMRSAPLTQMAEAAPQHQEV